MRDWRLLHLAWGAVYRATLALLWPLNWLLSHLRRNALHPRSVLHISYMVHIPHRTVQILRRHGMKADYMAIGGSPTWTECDYRVERSVWPFGQALREFALFWRVVARYEVVHSHFMIPMSVSGWELPWLRRMGRAWVVHYRGCEIRDRKRNLEMHPDVNICQECDYDPRPCESRLNAARRRLARRYASSSLVTTPDLLDFAPEATHLPFFAPETALPPRRRRAGGPLRIVHATNHSGIEGTRHIRAAVDRLREKGYDVELVFLAGVSPDRVLQEYALADLSVGKLKMGYYANAQIESMVLGVPAVTWVRPEFMSSEIESSGFILTSLDDLEKTLTHYLEHPEALALKSACAREGILRLHDNDVLACRLIAVYDDVRRKAGPGSVRDSSHASSGA